MFIIKEISGVSEDRSVELPAPRIDTGLEINFRYFLTGCFRRPTLELNELAGPVNADPNGTPDASDATYRLSALCTHARTCLQANAITRSEPLTGLSPVTTWFMHALVPEGDENIRKLPPTLLPGYI